MPGFRHNVHYLIYDLPMEIKNVLLSIASLFSLLNCREDRYFVFNCGLKKINFLTILKQRCNFFTLSNDKMKEGIFRDQEDLFYNRRLQTYQNDNFLKIELAVCPPKPKVLLRA